MKDRYQLGRIADVTFSARPSALLGVLFLWGVLAAAGRKFFKLNLKEAIGGGFVAAVLHLLSELWHQFGHARAAQHAGYPMEGVEMWGVLATSLYPEDEGDLTAEIHMQRAVGGPLASLALSAVAAGLALLGKAAGGVFWPLSLFFFIDNLLTFTLGAFLPLGFTDGGALLHYWRQRRRRIKWVQVPETRQ